MSANQAGYVTGLTLCLAVLLIVSLSLSVKWVPPNHVRYVMRQRKNWFGPPWAWPAHSYHRTLRPGLHMVMPGLDRVSAPVDPREPPPGDPPRIEDMPEL